MPKINYLGIAFDSQLEVDYYKYLQELWYKGEVLEFLYHPNAFENLVGKRSYTPDFVVLYPDRIEIIETKGYNPYSKMIDDQIHNVMLSKNQWALANYVLGTKMRGAKLCWIRVEDWDRNIKNGNVVYRKIKYLKAYGFVDYDFKNPNTLANQRKEKILSQKEEIKELKDFKKNAERYFGYHLKIVNNEKLTKPQREWYYKYVEELQKKYN